MKTKKILIIGIAGGLAQILTKRLWQEYPEYEIIGVDSRRIPDLSSIQNLKTIQIKFKRGSFENLFRENKFDIVYHLARMSLSSNSSTELAKRLELSVMGTNKILDLALEFGVEKFILLSTYHVYGASSENSIFLKEESPLRASVQYSELRDVVEMDQICEGFMWKNQNRIQTIMLRPCNIIGKQINNTMTKFLNSSLSLRPIDYNPMFQFIHEYDMATVLILAIEKLDIGIYNIAPDDYISLKEAVDIASKRSIPFVMSIAHSINKVLRIAKLDVPGYFIDYLKYSCLIDNKKIQNKIGKDFNRFKIKDTLRLIK